jgi:hypothetical protein
MTQVPVAEPSTATKSYLGTGFDEFVTRVSPPEKTDDKETKPEKSAEPGAADTSEKTKPEAQAKTAAEPGAARKQEPKEEKDKPSAEERIAQLTAEKKDLEDKLRKTAAPKSDAKPEVKAAAPRQEPKQEDTNEDGSPKYKTWDDWFAAVRKYDRETAVLEFEATQQQQAMQRELQGKMEEGRTRYQNFDDTIKPASIAIAEANIPIEIKGFISQSPYMTDLLYVLGSDPKALTEFLETARTNPFAALRKTALMETEIANELEKSKAKPASKSEAKAESSKEPPAKPEPRAPEPPKELGGKGTTPTDELDDAVRSDDYGRAKSEMSRRYFVASK